MFHHLAFKTPVSAPLPIVWQIEDLACILQLGTQCVVWQVLYVAVIIQTQPCRQPGRLSQDHEDRLHARATVGYVRGREAYGDEQVCCFPPLWHDTPVAYGIRVGRGDLHIPFVEDTGHTSFDTYESGAIV